MEVYERRVISLVGENIVTAAILTDQSGSGYKCAMNFSRNGSAVTRITVSFAPNTVNLANATFDYVFEDSFLMTSLVADIAGRVLKPVHFEYSPETGRLTKMGTFAFSNSRVHREVAQDVNVEITRESDRFDRETDVWFRFNNYVVFMLEVKYDALGRVHQWRRKVGLNSSKYIFIFFKFD